MRKGALSVLRTGTVCGPGYQVFVGSVFGPPNRPMVGYSQYPRYHSTPKRRLEYDFGYNTGKFVAATELFSSAGGGVLSARDVTGSNLPRIL
jgi:hypothetical protein